jgi:DNA (cytosine-5)-methyltransferase 1
VPSKGTATVRPEDSPSERRLTAGCLFAAIGGFCRAFQEAGAAVTWANEKDRYAKQTFTLNFPDVRFIHKPIEELSVEVDALEPVDILTAGFPCQPFSVAGEKRGFKDERGSLFLHITRLIREFGREKPKVLLLENVKHFRAHDGGRTFARVQAEIQRAGYWFSEKNAKVLNTATHTEIPQNRERIFMVALSANHFPANNFRFPDLLPPGQARPVREFLDLRKKAPDRLYFKPGDRYYPHFREAVDKGDPKAVYQLRRNYVRENKSGQCFTLMANMGDGGHNIPVIVDRWGIRKITPVECAHEGSHPLEDLIALDRLRGIENGSQTARGKGSILSDPVRAALAFAFRRGAGAAD